MNERCRYSRNLGRCQHQGNQPKLIKRWVTDGHTVSHLVAVSKTITINKVRSALYSNRDR